MIHLSAWLWTARLFGSQDLEVVSIVIAIPREDAVS